MAKSKNGWVICQLNRVNLLVRVNYVTNMTAQPKLTHLHKIQTMPNRINHRLTTQKQSSSKTRTHKLYLLSHAIRFRNGKIAQTMYLSYRFWLQTKVMLNLLNQDCGQWCWLCFLLSNICCSISTWFSLLTAISSTSILREQLTWSKVLIPW